ncbi:MAG: hypothetical protein AAF628_26100 [Planctomycetota bacterium]
MHLHRFVPALASVVLPTLLSAQTPVELIGLGDRTPAPVVRIDRATCATRTCPTLLTGAMPPPIGGTAYDATIGAVWVSNGPAIQAVDPDSCRIVCPPHVLPGVGTGVQITGLAINEFARALIVADDSNVIRQFDLGCSVTAATARCQLMLPLGSVLTGIASDDVRDLLIYSVASIGAPVGPANRLFIARRGDPCNPVCSVPVPVDCDGDRIGAITGVAYDGCRDVVVVTADQPGAPEPILLYLRVNPSNCQPQLVRCCTPALNFNLVGLAIKPSRATSVGTNCSNLGCPACPQMRHAVVGDAVLGNQDFRLDLRDAPANSVASLFLGAGACSPPGILVRPFCGPLLVPVVPFLPVVVSAPTGGGAGGGACSGNVRIRAPIPLDPVFCGGVLSTQFVGVCATAVLGTYVSNCQSWEITSS